MKMLVSNFHMSTIFRGCNLNKGSCVLMECRLDMDWPSYC